MESDMKLIGERIRFCRKEKKETLQQLGSAIGVHKSTIMRWEKGETERIGTAVLSALAVHFDVSALWLSGADAPMRSAKKSHSAIRIPVLGYVKAGTPIEAVQEILDYEEIPADMAAQGDCFALSVKGDSMEPRICQGDVVIVRKQECVDNGDVAVVLVGENEATVKKFFRNENGVKLIAFNPMFDPMFFTPDEVNTMPVTVIGKVIELRGKL